MEKPDTITVTTSHREEVKADRVDLHVTIKGTSLITGSAALKKAREVSQLVASLQEVGVQESDISLQSIRAENSGGVLGKTTSAMYGVRINCQELERLSEILGVVTGQKNAK